jgi:hypothetical protein
LGKKLSEAETKFKPVIPLIPVTEPSNSAKKLSQSQLGGAYELQNQHPRLQEVPPASARHRHKRASTLPDPAVQPAAQSEVDSNQLLFPQFQFKEELSMKTKEYVLTEEEVVILREACRDYRSALRARRPPAKEPSRAEAVAAALFNQFKFDLISGAGF